MKNKPNLYDLIIFAAVAAAAGILLACRAAFPKNEAGKTVEISLRGEFFAEMPLDRDGSLDVDGVLTVTVSGGEARVSDAVCKNRLCVRHAPISREGEAIVCLPGEVTVRVRGGPDALI